MNLPAKRENATVPKMILSYLEFCLMDNLTVTCIGPHSLSIGPSSFCHIWLHSSYKET